MLRQKPPSAALDIKRRPTTTATRCCRILGNLELGPNQLHRVIDFAPFQKL